MTDQGKLNVGWILHLLEIAVLFISIGMTYERFNETRNQVEAHTVILTRIEHYLSTKDKNYWKISKDNQ